MKIHTDLIKIKSKNGPEFIDLTGKVENILKESKVKNGIVTVYSKHTTGAVRINEFETGIRGDFGRFLDSVLPSNKYYAHNDLTIRTENLACENGGEECLNGHSHCQQLIMGTSETIPVVEGKMTLGRWQKIIFIELDSPRIREIVIQVMGE